jgi:hypothetical protein
VVGSGYNSALPEAVPLAAAVNEQFISALLAVPSRQRRTPPKVKRPPPTMGMVVAVINLLGEGLSAGVL